MAQVDMPHLSFSSFLSGVWSTVSLRALPFRQSMARLSPTLATTSSMPSLSSATVAVVPALSTEAVKHQRESQRVKPKKVRCTRTLHWTWHDVKIMHLLTVTAVYTHAQTHITLVYLHTLLYVYSHRLYSLSHTYTHKHTALMNCIE